MVDPQATDPNLIEEIVADSDELPEAFPWPEEITPEEYRTFMPAGVAIELVDGFLFGGTGGAESRLRLLALLLRNCGLEKAVCLADPMNWRNALERSFFLGWE